MNPDGTRVNKGKNKGRSNCATTLQVCSANILGGCLPYLGSGDRTPTSWPYQLPRGVKKPVIVRSTVTSPKSGSTIEKVPSQVVRLSWRPSFCPDCE